MDPITIDPSTSFPGHPSGSASTSPAAAFRMKRREAPKLPGTTPPVSSQVRGSKGVIVWSSMCRAYSWMAPKMMGLVFQGNSLLKIVFFWYLC